MSSAPDARRRPPERRVPAGRRSVDDFSGFEPMEHNQWTVEGQIEQVGRFARSINRATGWRRWTGKAVLIVPVLGTLAFALLSLVVVIVRAAF